MTLLLAFNNLLQEMKTDNLLRKCLQLTMAFSWTFYKWLWETNTDSMSLQVTVNSELSITCCKIQIPKTCGEVVVNFQYMVAAKCSAKNWKQSIILLLTVGHFFFASYQYMAGYFGVEIFSRMRQLLQSLYLLFI